MTDHSRFMVIWSIGTYLSSQRDAIYFKSARCDVSAVVPAIKIYLLKQTENTAAEMFVCIGDKREKERVCVSSLWREKKCMCLGYGWGCVCVCVCVCVCAQAVCVCVCVCVHACGQHACVYMHMHTIKSSKTEQKKVHFNKFNWYGSLCMHGVPATTLTNSN